MKYIFWDQYNSQSISGLPKLLIMGVKAMACIKHDVALVSDKHSLIYKILKDENIEFQHISTEDVLEHKAEISHEDVLMLPSLSPRHFIFDEYNPLVYVWQIYPSVCVTNKLRLLLLKYQFRVLESHHAFVTMDDTCYDTICREIGWKIKAPIIPMPIDHTEYKYKSRVISPDDIMNISYLGRAQDWKIYPLIKMVSDCAELTNRRFAFYVFTDDKKHFSEMLSHYVKGNITINYFEKYYGERLLNEICKMDLHFAMGISVLEGAALGVPTLLASLSYSPIGDDYRYSFLHESPKDYAGGVYKEGHLWNKGRKLCDVLRTFEDIDAVKQCSESDYETACKYSLQSVANQILKIDTSLTIRKANRIQLSWWRKNFF